MCHDQNTVLILYYFFMYVGGLFIFGFLFSQNYSTPIYIYIYTPSGKHTNNYGKSPFLMGKSTISMVIFNMIIYPIMGILGILAMRQKDPCYFQKNGLMLKSPLKMLKQSSGKKPTIDRL